jgi:hypothetical protein
MTAFLLAAALVLPAPDTASRGRDFCDAWDRLPVAERHAVVEHADRAETANDPARLRHREAVRARVVDAVSAECTNWHLLMDFEVRATVDGVQRDGAPLAE